MTEADDLAAEVAALGREIAELRQLVLDALRAVPPSRSVSAPWRSCSACARTGICNCVLSGPRITC